MLSVGLSYHKFKLTCGICVVLQEAFKLTNFNQPPGNLRRSRSLHRRARAALSSQFTAPSQHRRNRLSDRRARARSSSQSTSPSQHRRSRSLHRRARVRSSSQSTAPSQHRRNRLRDRRARARSSSQSTSPSHDRRSRSLHRRARARSSSQSTSPSQHRRNRLRDRRARARSSSQSTSPSQHRRSRSLHRRARARSSSLSTSPSQHRRNRSCHRHLRARPSSQSTSQSGIRVGHVTYLNNKRVRDKKLPCFLCKVAVQWLSRHLERNHSDNVLVAQVLAKTGAERLSGLKRLKNLGAFQHNVGVLSRGTGELIVARRTSGKASAHSYLPCTRCFGFYHKHDLWRHICPCRDDKPKTSKDAIVNSRSLLDGALSAEGTGVDKDLKKHVLYRMRQDKRYDVIMTDELILKFGSSLLKRVGVKGRRRIAARMRLLAQLLQTVRELVDQPDKSLQFFLDGTYYDAIVEATEKLSGAAYNDVGHRVFAKPAVVASIGNLLRKCCGLKKGLAARRSDSDDLCKEVDRFMTLFNSDWSDCMSCPASAAQKQKTYNKPEELPSTDDLVKLKEFTEQKLSDLSERLKSEATYKVWRSLAETVLARLVVFNKRRASEPAKMLLSHYVERPDWNNRSNSELLNNLKPMEKVLMKRMDLVQVPGKRNRRVPILITPEVGQAMQLLVDTRSRCGIAEENSYFFATDSKDGHLDSWLVLHNMSISAGVASPRLITSCRLRKYVATLAQVWCYVLV